MVEGEQRGTVWPEDVPEDVLTGGGDAPVAVPPAAPLALGDTPSAPIAIAVEPEARKRAHLKLVD